MSTIIRKTYSAGALDIATLVTTNGLGLISWLLSDHLGSTSITVRANGTKSAELRYSAFGETRYTSGTTPTDYRYTGQLQQGAVNLYYYNARWYDPKLGRFVQADTIIPTPGDPQSWDRYAYVKNNPLRYSDPSGRYYCEGETTGKHNIYHTFTQHEYIEYRINSDYGVILNGSWDTENLRNLLVSLNNLELSLGRIKHFTNGSIYSFSNNPSYYGGFTIGGNISFHGWKGGIPFKNFYHEIAHAINNRSGGYFTNQLSAKIITDKNGNYIMGGSVSEYNRNSDGYITSGKILDPNGMSVDAQQHPGSLSCSATSNWCADGNTANEEWADLIANFVSGNFDNNIGMIRKNWILDVFTNYWLTKR